MSVTTEPYHDLVGGISLVEGTWDDTSFTVPLGYNFEFFGETTTNLYSLEFFTGGIFTTNLDVNALNVIAAFSADLIDRGYDIDLSLSPISYKIEGVAGTRTTTIEYNNAGFFSGTTNNGIYIDFINLQLKIFEASGDIEIHIGPYSVMNPDLDFEGAPGPVIGLIEGLDYDNAVVNGEVLLLNGDPLNPEIITAFVESYVNWPIPENTVYKFSRHSTAIHELNSLELNPFYFPNPCNQFVTLKPELRGEIKSPVIVINGMGQLVRTANHPERIELDDLPPGIYQLRFQTSTSQVAQRISLLR